jgi:hypothetical protein
MVSIRNLYLLHSFLVPQWELGRGRTGVWKRWEKAVAENVQERVTFTLTQRTGPFLGGQ